MAPEERSEFYVSEAIIDEYARILGPIGIAVYTMLAYYSDPRTGETCMTIDTIAEKLHLNHPTVEAQLQKFLDLSLIAINPHQRDEDDPSVRRYILLDPLNKNEPWRFEYED